MNGYAREAGAIFIDTSSTLAFGEPLIAGFYHNIADQGSAIYSSIKEEHGNIQIRPEKKISLSNVTSINISLYFSNNTNGVVHNSFYAPFFSHYGNQTSPNLLFNATTWDSDRSQFAYTTLIDTTLHMDRMDKYTSLANGLCIRVPGKNWECNYLDREPSSESCPAETLLSTTVYPGQMAYSVLYPDNRHYEGGYCHNQNNLPSQSPTLMSISINRENFTMDFWLPQSLPAYNSSVYRVVWVVDMLPPIPIIAPILQFNVSDCPLGFSIRSGSCACDGELQSHNYSCDINTKGFEGPPSYWTGLVGQSLLFDGHCHPNYCDSDRNDFHFTDDPAEACLGNRTGVLCGECKRTTVWCLAPTLVTITALMCIS